MFGILTPDVNESLFLVANVHLARSYIVKSPVIGYRHILTMNICDDHARFVTDLERILIIYIYVYILFVKPSIVRKNFPLMKKAIFK